MEVHQNLWFFHGSIEDHFQLIELTIYHLLMQKEKKKQYTFVMTRTKWIFQYYMTSKRKQQSSNNR